MPMKRGEMETLLLVPLDDAIVFPGMTATLALDVGNERRVLLVPRTDGEFASVGTVAEIVEQMRIPGGPEPRGQARAAPDTRRHRAPRESVEDPARTARRASGARPYP